MAWLLRFTLAVSLLAVGLTDFFHNKTVQVPVHVSSSRQPVQGQDVTIICKISVSVGFLTWKLENESLSFCSVDGCKPQQSAPRYSFSVNKSYTSITVENFQFNKDKGTWSCDYPPYLGCFSFSGVIYPVSETIINTSSTFTNGTITIREQEKLELQCRTNDDGSTHGVRFTWTFIDKEGHNQTIHFKTANSEAPINESNPDLIIAASNASIEVNRSMNGWKVSCWATNNNVTGYIRSEDVTLDVIYGPQAATINGFRVPYYTGSRVSGITCNTNCNPECNVRWTHNGSAVDSPFPIESVTYHNAGTYVCFVQNNLTSEVNSTAVNLTVKPKEVESSKFFKMPVIIGISSGGGILILIIAIVTGVLCRKKYVKVNEKAEIEKEEQPQSSKPASRSGGLVYADLELSTTSLKGTGKGKKTEKNKKEAGDKETVQIHGRKSSTEYAEIVQPFNRLGIGML